nr:MAG TPA: hypothetical protein [Caudoviricetes sp.]
MSFIGRICPLFALWGAKISAISRRMDNCRSKE